MPYLVIEDFKGGLDYRRSRFASPAGTLRELTNAVITRGGEIESTKGFEIIHAFAPSDAHGLFSGANNVATFGTASAASVGSVPAGITYNELAASGGATIVSMIGACQFGTNWFAMANMSTGDQRCFYNGAQIPNTEPVATATPFLVDCITFGNNVYALSQSTLYRSKIGDPSLWKSTDTGAFAIDLAATGMEAYGARGLSLYEGLLVVYGARQIQFWQMDPDPSKCVMVRQLDNVGAFAKRSIARYGDRDSFFVSYSGVRSLRIRDSSGAATVNDVGSPIDERLEEWVPGNLSFKAAVEPKTGRYFLALPDDRVLVYCRSDGISAWGEIDPGFEVTDIATAGGRLFVKSGGTIRRYGGADDADYSDVMPTVELPFLDMGKPATEKALTFIDAVLEGEWQVDVSCDINNPDAWRTIATIDGTSYDLQRIAVYVRGTHFALRLTGVGAPGMRRRLSNLVLHYETSEAG